MVVDRQVLIEQHNLKTYYCQKGHQICLVKSNPNKRFSKTAGICRKCRQDLVTPFLHCKTCFNKEDYCIRCAEQLGFGTNENRNHRVEMTQVRILREWKIHNSQFFIQHGHLNPKQNQTDKNIVLGILHNSIIRFVFKLVLLSMTFYQ